MRCTPILACAILWGYSSPEVSFSCTKTDKTKIWIHNGMADCRSTPNIIVWYERRSNELRVFFSQSSATIQAFVARVGCCCCLRRMPSECFGRRGQDDLPVPDKCVQSAEKPLTLPPGRAITRDHAVYVNGMSAP